MEENRAKALAAALSQIEKQFGKGSIMRMDAEAFPAGAILFAQDCYEALEGADACLVLTEWEDFAVLDLARVKALLRCPIVIDGRNLFSPIKMEAAGLNYYSVGRPDVVDEAYDAGPPAALDRALQDD